MIAHLLALALAQTPAHTYPDCEKQVGPGWDVPAVETPDSYVLTKPHGAYNVCRQSACEAQLDLKVPTAVKTVGVAPWAWIAITAALGVALAAGAFFVGRETGRAEQH